MRKAGTFLKRYFRKHSNDAKLRRNVCNCLGPVSDLPSSRRTSLCWVRVHTCCECYNKKNIRTWYVYQIFIFHFPFDEIYRRLFFFTLGRMYHTLWYQVRIMYQIRMIPLTYCIAICLFVSGWWYAWYLRSAQETAESLFVYSLVGGGITRTFRRGRTRLTTVTSISCRSL